MSIFDKFKRKTAVFRLDGSGQAITHGNDQIVNFNNEVKGQPFATGLSSNLIPVKKGLKRFKFYECWWHSDGLDVLELGIYVWDEDNSVSLGGVPICFNEKDAGKVQAKVDIEFLVDIPADTNIYLKISASFGHTTYQANAFEPVNCQFHNHLQIEEED